MFTAALDMKKVRRDFPMLSKTMNGKPLAYLDNAATTQKPLAVIERMSVFLRDEYATVHRGIYAFSQNSTIEFDRARELCRKFLNAAEASEVIFTRGTTEAINLVASTFGKKQLKPGDEVIVSEIEHHSNLVVWQQLALDRGLVLKFIPANDRGELDLEAFQKMLGPRTYLVAVAHVSNALGTIHPIAEIIKMARHAGAAVLIDGAQGAPHSPVDVQELGCDFYAFSGHKIYGPTGVGVLYGKRKHLEAMPPYQYGGDMIETVTLERSTFAPIPAKFEAGTPAIVEIIGLGAALEYLEKTGWGLIRACEEELLKYATGQLSKIPGLRIVGTAEHKASLVSFVLDGVHPHDVGQVLSGEGVAVRSGNHCAMPAMKRYGVPATTRASFSFYNTKEEIDILCRGIQKAMEMFQ